MRSQERSRNESVVYRSRRGIHNRNDRAGEPVHPIGGDIGSIADLIA